MQQVTEEIVKIQAKGLITIPKSLRESIGLNKDSLARVRKEKGRLIIEPLRTLAYPVRSYTGQDLADFFDLDEKETKILRKKGLI